MLRIAIVTGASVGLGKEYVRQLDQSGEVDEIWMVARRSDLLDSVAADLVHSKGRVFAADLTRAETMKPFYEALHRDKHDVVWLVNNAGFGKTGAFDGPPVEVNLSMVDLNIRAMVEMTQRVLPHCRRGCHILQVGSSAGWKPMPNFSLYAATKSFVNSFAIAVWSGRAQWIGVGGRSRTRAQGRDVGSRGSDSDGGDPDTPDLNDGACGELRIPADGDGHERGSRDPTAACHGCNRWHHHINPPHGVGRAGHLPVVCAASSTAVESGLKLTRQRHPCTVDDHARILQQDLSQP